MKKFRLLGFLLVAPLLTLAVAVQSMAAESSSQLTLSEALNQALEKNPEIQLLRQRLQVMSARAKQAPYLEDPEIAIQLGGIPFANPTALDRAFTNSIGIRQKLPFLASSTSRKKSLSRKPKSRRKSCEPKSARSRQGQDGLRRSLHGAKIDRDIARASGDSPQPHPGNRGALPGGASDRTRCLQGAVEPERAENQLVVAEAERSANELRVNALMNRSPQTPMMVPADLTAPDLMLTPLALADLALTNRPELKGAQEDIERTERMYELAERNRKFPTSWWDGITGACRRIRWPRTATREW